MFSDEFPELSEPYQSDYFSGDRHIIRKTQETTAISNLCEPAHLLQVNTLIGIKSDDVMDEAKSLLNGWMQEDRIVVSDSQFQDEFNYADSWMEQSSKKSKSLEKDLSAVRQMILESIPDKIEKRVGHKNLGVALRVRHEMARERRLIIEEQKNLRKLQMDVRQAKIKEQVSSRQSQSSRNGNEKLANSRKKIASDIATFELANIKEDQALNAKEAVIQLKKTELVQAQQESDKVDRKDEIVENTSFHNKDAYAKAELMKLAKDTQCKRRALSAWIRLVSDSKRQEQVVNVKLNWRPLNHFWAKWKRETKQRNEKRELELIALELRQEQQKMIRAMRHDRLRRLSNALIAWKEWIVLERQEKMIRIAHERRALKMQQFLMQLENKHIQTAQPVIVKSKEKKEAAYDSRPIPHVNTVAAAAEAADDTQHIPAAPVHSDEAPDKAPSKKRPGIVRVSHVKILKPSKSDQKIMEAMQNRERLRLERKAELAKQKEERQKEIERAKLERENEKERLEMEQRDQIIAERKRLEKETRELLLIKQKEREAVQGKIDKAKKFYKKKFLLNYGLRPLQKFVADQKQMQLDACIFHRRAFLKSALGVMKRKIKAKEIARNKIADNFYSNNSLTSCFTLFKKISNKVIDQSRIALYLSNSNMLKSSMRSWRLKYQAKVEIQQMEEREKFIVADHFAAKAIPRRYLSYWKQFVKDQKEERWRQYRKNRLREAAKDVLSSLSNSKSTSLPYSLNSLAQ